MTKPNRLFFTLWTSKEAYLKAIGTGLSLSLDRFEVRLVPEEPMARVRLLGESREHENCLVRILSLGPDYAGAVAAEGEDWQSELPAVASNQEADRRRG